ncbi:MAG: EpsI family protein [Armatimonadota bacterium]|nr:EpsI family protein [Armatimonadota bacterium]
MRSLQRNTFGVAAVSVVFAVLTFFVRPAMIFGRVVEKFDDVPRAIGEWIGRDADSRQSARLLPNSAVLVRDYYNGSGRQANLLIVYGLDIADIHDPQYCFEGEGWKVIAGQTVKLQPASGPAHPARMTLLQRSGGGYTVGIHWYASPNGSKDTLAAQRLDIWKNALLSRRVHPSALVRILVPVTEGQNTAELDALSLAFYLDEPVVRMVSRSANAAPADMADGR